MSVIRTTIVTPFILEAYLEYIDKVLFIAGEYGGKAFGSFPRNVIVPRMNDPSCNVSFDNVDLWFTTEQSAKQFIKQMQPASNVEAYKFTEVTCYNPNALIKRYGYHATQYNLTIRGTSIAWFNVFVNRKVPVGDFDVNCLTYLCKRDYSTGKTITTKELSVKEGMLKDYIIGAINKKEARMFGEYAKTIDEEDLARIHRFIWGGWSITAGNVKVSSLSKIPLLFSKSENNERPVKPLEEMTINDMTALCIDDVLFTAGLYNGKAIGSFIRNAIIPKIEDPTTINVSFDNVDLWFTKETNAQDFLETMRSKGIKLGVQYTFTEDEMIERYGCLRTQYKLAMFGSDIARFYIIISEEFPVNDFHVNCFSYLCRKDYSTGKEIVTKELQGEKGYQKEELIAAIKRKQAIMFEDYPKKIINNKYYINEVNNLLIKDWTITLQSNVNLVEPEAVIVKEHEAKALITPSVDDTLEDLVRNNPLVKDAIARIITKMICETATVIESKPSLS